MSALSAVADIFRPLDSVPLQASLSDRVQLADLLEWILSQAGPADIRISSFSLAEEFLRRIYFIGRKGLVRSLDILLDLKATNKTRILWPFIAQTVRSCHLSTNHSKVLLIRSDSMTVSVLTSQNLTRGNRYESYLVATSPDLFAVLSAQFDDIVKSQSVPFDDIFASTVGSG